MLKAMVAKVVAFTAAVWLISIPSWAASAAGTTLEILALERRAMDGWLTGDPEPTLRILDPEISYFHIMTEKRVDGIAGVKAIFEQYRGRPLYDSYEMADPRVSITGDAAVLTYILVFQRNGVTSKWNSTQVYLKKKDGWRVIHSHWSQTRPSA
jgi:hypothetical protein